MLKKESILVLKPSKNDRLEAAKFASKTIGWTFNRMAYNYSKKGQNNRCFNIVKGIIAQEMLKTHLENNGIEVITDNSFRSSDIFDFLVKKNDEEIRLDLKTNNHYSNYNIPSRPNFNLDLVIDNQTYPGPDWRRFFPMLMPHNQINQDKDAYCFGIASSVDFRSNVDIDRDDYYLAFFPYDVFVSFISNKKLCSIREDKKRGIYLELKYLSDSLYKTNIDIEIIGEWLGDYKIEKVTLTPNNIVKHIGPFSMISSFRVEKVDYDKLDGSIQISVSKNELKDEVLNSKKEDINVVPDTYMEFFKNDICNLMLPKDYTLYLFGWVYKRDFLSVCMNYPSWVWPIDKIDKFQNQNWSQLTESDVKSITKLGFQHAITKKPTKFSAGWMKTNGRGGGACCYVFPNIGRNGGVMETNLYVLPSDLNELNLLFN